MTESRVTIPCPAPRRPGCVRISTESSVPCNAIRSSSVLRVGVYLKIILLGGECHRADSRSSRPRPPREQQLRILYRFMRHEHAKHHRELARRGHHARLGEGVAGTSTSIGADFQPVGIDRTVPVRRLNSLTTGAMCGSNLWLKNERRDATAGAQGSSWANAEIPISKPLAEPTPFAMAASTTPKEENLYP